MAEGLLDQIILVGYGVSRKSFSICARSTACLQVVKFSYEKSKEVVAAGYDEQLV